MYLYKITNTITNSIYIGITINCLSKRFNAHKCSAKRGTKSSLYDAMRTYGSSNFKIETLNTFSNKEKLYKAEKNAIKSFKKSGYKLYNILEGGASYFPVVDIEAWKNKLKVKRVGRKPALGMTHTDENKKLFSEVSRAYWDTQIVYDCDEIIKYSFKEANSKFGISKTHYYRIRNNLTKK